MRRPAGKPDAPNRRAARRARLAGPAVDRELILEPAAQPGPADVVADGRAATVDRPGEHGLDRLPQPVGLRPGERLPLAPRVQFREETGLVGVNVPDPGDHPLI